jgi:exonuclease III
MLVTTGVVSDSVAQPLRLVAFNVQCLAAPGTRDTRLPRFRWDSARKAHFEKVASVIETLDPDIVCLIEVTSQQSMDFLLEILGEKGMTDYRGYHAESHDSFSGFDVAFLSRIEPDAVDGNRVQCVYSPPGDPTWREAYSYTDEDGQLHERDTGLNRNALMYVTVGDQKLGLLGLHLKSNPSDEAANQRRTAEAKIARRIIQREIVARGYQPIVLGDFNDYDPDVPDRDPERDTRTQVIRSLKNYDRRQAGDELVNAAQRIQRLADRYTSHWDVNENGVADGEDVFTMIDHVLLHRSLADYQRRVFICRCTGLETSDHWPVVVDLQFPES